MLIVDVLDEETRRVQLWPDAISASPAQIAGTEKPESSGS